MSAQGATWSGATEFGLNVGQLFNCPVHTVISMHSVQCTVFSMLYIAYKIQ